METGFMIPSREDTERIRGGIKGTSGPAVVCPCFTLCTRCGISRVSAEEAQRAYEQAVPISVS